MLLFGLSAQPQLSHPALWFGGADKLAHAFVYAVLAALLLFADRWPPAPRAWGWAAVASVYGLSDELHQLLVPTRQPDVLDLAADALGALVAVAAVLHARRSIARRREV